MVPGPFFTARGVRITLSTQLVGGRGGEGAVFSVAGNPDLVAKIYHSGNAAARRDKVEAMVNANLHRSASYIAYPIDALYDSRKAFIGLTMKNIVNAEAMHNLFSSRDREEKFQGASVKLMVRAALNLARAIAELHDGPCVIGDISPSNILVTREATVQLIDTDSFQCRINANIFTCPVVTPDYIPPELLTPDADLHQPRSSNQDCFGLAFMIFQLLMAGFRPFQGRWLDPNREPPSPTDWIREFLYAYGSDSLRLPVAPPPAAPRLDWASEPIRSAFDQAFGLRGIAQRPTAAEWVDLLEAFEKDLVACRKSEGHWLRRGDPKCPWCEAARLSGPLFEARGTRQQKSQAHRFLQVPLPIKPANAKVHAPRPQPAPQQSPNLAVSGASTTRQYLFQAAPWLVLAAVGALILLSDVRGPQSQPTASYTPASPVLTQQASPTVAIPVGPSFQCNGPTIRSDLLALAICSDAGLARLDLALVQAFQALQIELWQSRRIDLRSEAIDHNNAVRNECEVPRTGVVDTALVRALGPCVRRIYENKRAEWIGRLSRPEAREEALRPLERHIALQQSLGKLGYLSSDTAIDGVYSSRTRSAISAWQRAAGRTDTGFLSNVDADLLERSTITPAQRSTSPATEARPQAPVAAAAPARSTEAGRPLPTIALPPERSTRTAPGSSSEEDRTNLSDRVLIELVQIQLAILGYDVGPVDGVVGVRTSRAIRLFAQSQALSETNSMTLEVVTRLSLLVPSRQVADFRQRQAANQTPLAVTVPVRPNARTQATPQSCVTFDGKTICD